MRLSTQDEIDTMIRISPGRKMTRMPMRFLSKIENQGTSDPNFLLISLSVIVLFTGCRNEDASTTDSPAGSKTATLPPTVENSALEESSNDVIPTPAVAPDLQKILIEKSMLGVSKAKLADVTKMISQMHQDKFTFEIFGALGETVVSIDSEGPFEDLLDEMLAPADLTWKAVGTKIIILPKEEVTQE